MWDQADCVDYLKTAAVIAAYVDQSLSTNTFYNPAYYANNKVPATVIAGNLMRAHRWGLKTIYYSLINKVGAKSALTTTTMAPVHQLVTMDTPTEEEACEACVL